MTIAFVETCVETHSVEETFRLGKAFAQCLSPGDVVGLMGDLGAGKTHLVQAVALGLGVDRDDVNSPTFVLIQEYDADLPVCHIDAYRLNDVDEFLELGADEILGADNVCLIEWADRVAEVLPQQRIEVHIDVSGESTRRFRFQATQTQMTAIRQTLETCGFLVRPEKRTD